MIKVECSFANKWEFYNEFNSVKEFKQHLEEHELSPSSFKLSCGVCGAGLATAIQEVKGRMRMDYYPTCTNPTCRKEYKE